MATLEDHNLPDSATVGEEDHVEVAALDDLCIAHKVLDMPLAGTGMTPAQRRLRDPPNHMFASRNSELRAKEDCQEMMMGV